MGTLAGEPAIASLLHLNPQRNHRDMDQERETEDRGGDGEAFVETAGAAGDRGGHGAGHCGGGGRRGGGGLGGGGSGGCCRCRGSRFGGGRRRGSGRGGRRRGEAYRGRGRRLGRQGDADGLFLRLDLGRFAWRRRNGRAGSVFRHKLCANVGRPSEQCQTFCPAGLIGRWVGPGGVPSEVGGRGRGDHSEGAVPKGEGKGALRGAWNGGRRFRRSRQHDPRDAPTEETGAKQTGGPKAAGRIARWKRDPDRGGGRVVAEAGPARATCSGAAQ